MKLELALVLSCSKSGCQVALLESNLSIEVLYSSLVQDRIMIKPEHMVAIDMDTDPPEIVWRWLRAAVIELNDSIVVVGDMKGHPGKVSLIPEIPLSLSIDDDVWICGTGQAFEIHDLIVGGKPTHPQRLLKYITPIINRIYQEE